MWLFIYNFQVHMCTYVFLECVHVCFQIQPFSFDTEAFLHLNVCFFFSFLNFNYCWYTPYFQVIFSGFTLQVLVLLFLFIFIFFLYICVYIPRSVSYHLSVECRIVKSYLYLQRALYLKLSDHFYYYYYYF